MQIYHNYKYSETDYRLLPPPERDAPIEFDLDADDALELLVEAFADEDDAFD